ncbi:tRNA(Ile)-lysidine synthase TilS/MesJ [Lachnospiraceae bacterium C10]|jgi:tRNA(Ile)-lysidine synthase TilS/MesJ/rhodanese-related sulfurtransferase|nr:ATPase [Lachnospiraceae bacterium]SCW42982.1 tRNA(Ile)-lysidine synthase TilS/MesJ [Lachnospiraceae bacterium C10]SDW93571.1 tRNA(Ile)-lysidine synthase TilS/MesJ [Lachnospiraceae bacterium KHCPX20]
MSWDTLEITSAQLGEKRLSSYLLIDMRNEDALHYGMIPQAKAVASAKLMDHAKEWREEGLAVVLYCMTGELSVPAAEELRKAGVDAYSLKGGYADWIVWDMKNCASKKKEAEESIRKAFHKKLFTPFAKALNTYELLSPGDHVAVCVSGGKDSFLMAKLFQEIQRHNKFDFKLTFLCMNPGYNETNRLVIENNARLLDIPLEMFDSDIFDVVDTIDKNPCYLCARMRRGHLYAKAKELGCNKIALGHHYDDVIETILMGMLYGAQVQTMMPKLHSSNFEGMELIRPLYLIREDDIKRWRDVNGLHFIQCACHFTDTCSAVDPEAHTNSKRMEIKHLIQEMKKVNPYVEGNIFKSVENVNLRTILAYKENGQKHFFTENYDRWGQE